MGLHARPCHSVVSTAMSFKSELRIANGDHVVNGKSILELMTLNAAYGCEVELRARGEDAERLLTELAALFESGFGESP